MVLSLPPKGLIQCNEEMAQYVYYELTSVIWGHPKARSTYHFYEEIDAWLGPWGKKGYPIGYGKLYNYAFVHNKQLMNNHTTKNWILKATVILQEILRDFIVQKIQDGTLPSEQQIRNAAFDSHSVAYTQAGLLNVVLKEPFLLHIILLIPIKEFSQKSDDFEKTIVELFETILILTPSLCGIFTKSASLIEFPLVGPVHARIIEESGSKVCLTLQFILTREFSILKQRIDEGRLDYIPWLDDIIEKLDNLHIPENERLNELILIVTRAILMRRRHIVKKLNDILKHSPELKNQLNQPLLNTIIN